MLGYIETSELILFLYSVCTGVLKLRNQKMLCDDSKNNNDINCHEQKPVYSGELPRPLKPGFAVEIRATPRETCNRFSINFQSDKKTNSDIAFHLNPRLDMKYIVRNYRVLGMWHTEETVSPYQLFNITRDTQFQIIVLLTEKQFLVAINGQHFCSYDYRVPLTRVRHLLIMGPITLHTVDYRDIRLYPNEIQTQNDTYKIPYEDNYQDDNNILPSPFVGNLSKGLQTGWQIEIHGKVKLLPHSFYVNLQEGNQIWPHPIIPLHLNPRFNTTVKSHTVIRNSWMNGSWGQEEVCPGFYFTPSKRFRLVIQIDTDRYLVWIDSKLQGEFKFRQTQTNINTIYITGDVFIDKVYVVENFTNQLLLEPIS